MPVAHWDPFRELMSLRERMNRLIEQTMAKTESGTGSSTTSWTPAVDLYEASTHLVLTAELPEVDLDDIELRLDEDRITLRGERHHKDSPETQQFQRMERTFGPFTRSFALPVSIDKEQVKAEFKDGVLTVTLPKRADDSGHQIPISS